MYTRLLNFAFRHSVFATLFVLPQYLSAKSTIKKYIHSDEFLKVENNISAYQDDYSQFIFKNDLNWQRDSIIINEAFRHAGFNGPIYVTYGQTRTGVLSAWDKNDNYAAFISINNTDFHQNEKRDLELYSIMGHEAIHALHDDSHTKYIARSLIFYIATAALIKLSFSPTIPQFLCKKGYLNPGQHDNQISMGMLGVLFPPFLYYKDNITYFLSLPLARYHEIRADKESARKLGTASSLANILLDDEANNRARNKKTTSSWKSLFSVHPAHLERADYLKKLMPDSAHTPRLFQSSIYIDQARKMQKTGEPRRSPFFYMIDNR